MLTLASDADRDFDLYRRAFPNMRKVWDLGPGQAFSCPRVIVEEGPETYLEGWVLRPSGLRRCSDLFEQIVLRMKTKPSNAVTVMFTRKFRWIAEELERTGGTYFASYIGFTSHNLPRRHLARAGASAPSRYGPALGGGEWMTFLTGLGSETVVDPAPYERYVGYALSTVPFTRPLDCHDLPLRADAAQCTEYIAVAYGLDPLLNLIPGGWHGDYWVNGRHRTARFMAERRAQELVAEFDARDPSLNGMAREEFIDNATILYMFLIGPFGPQHLESLEPLLDIPPYVRSTCLSGAFARAEPDGESEESAESEPLPETPREAQNTCGEMRYRNIILGAPFRPPGPYNGGLWLRNATRGQNSRVNVPVRFYDSSTGSLTSRFTIIITLKYAQTLLPSTIVFLRLGPLNVHHKITIRAYNHLGQEICEPTYSEDYSTFEPIGRQHVADGIWTRAEYEGVFGSMDALPLSLLLEQQPPPSDHRPIPLSEESPPSIRVRTQKAQRYQAQEGLAMKMRAPSAGHESDGGLREPALLITLSLSYPTWTQAWQLRFIIQRHDIDMYDAPVGELVSVCLRCVAFFIVARTTHLELCLVIAQGVAGLRYVYFQCFDLSPDDFNAIGANWVLFPRPFQAKYPFCELPLDPFVQHRMAVGALRSLAADERRRRGLKPGPTASAQSLLHGQGVIAVPAFYRLTSRGGGGVATDRHNIVLNVHVCVPIEGVDEEGLDHRTEDGMAVATHWGLCIAWAGCDWYTQAETQLQAARSRSLPDVLYLELERSKIVGRLGSETFHCAVPPADVIQMLVRALSRDMNIGRSNKDRGHPTPGIFISPQPTLRTAEHLKRLKVFLAPSSHSRSGRGQYTLTLSMADVFESAARRLFEGWPRQGPARGSLWWGTVDGEEEPQPEPEL